MKKEEAKEIYPVANQELKRMFEIVNQLKQLGEVKLINDEINIDELYAFVESYAAIDLTVPMREISFKEIKMDLLCFINSMNHLEVLDKRLIYYSLVKGYTLREIEERLPFKKTRVQELKYIAFAKLWKEMQLRKITNGLKMDNTALQSSNK